MYLLAITDEILYFISGFGILQGILLSALLYFHPKSDRTVNSFLALYIFGITVVMTMPITINAVEWRNSHFLMPIPMLPGIFLYLYLLSFKETITWKKALPHTYILFIVFGLSFWNLKLAGRIYPDAKEIPPEVLKRPLTVAIVIIRAGQQFIYYFLCRHALKKYQQSLRQLFSETSRIDLNWARFLVNGYLVLFGSFLIIFPLMIRFPEYLNSLLLLNMAIATPYLYMATFKGVLQPTLWQLQGKEVVETEMHDVEMSETEKNAKMESETARKRLPDSKLGEIADGVIALLEKEKLFQEPELSLLQLAEKLQQPSYLVSQAINEDLKKNFYDLVNGYRVEEAKRLLLDAKNRNYTILSVGFEAGFNSKTTFNTVFKKFTGMAPTEFRVKEKQQLSETE